MQTGAAALGGAAVGVGVGHQVWADESEEPPGLDQVTARPRRTVDFHGEHQAGIETPLPTYAAFVGLDLEGGEVADTLGRLLRLLSDDAARLTQGRPALADTEPDLAGEPHALTITFGLGPRVLRRLGGDVAGFGLEELPAFGIDRLQRRWGQTDVLVQLRCDDPLVLSHARRVITKDTRRLARVRWVQEGFRGGPVTPAGTGRNLMGQVDGTVNPAFGSPEFDAQVWIDDAPTGIAGGTCLALRRIEMRLDLWDVADRVGREFVVGRRLDDGAPLTGENELDPVDLAKLDRHGFPVIDAASHVARAHATNPDEFFLRAPYNYQRERDDGSTESGLLFTAYAADLARQFVPVQQRLADLDRLNRYTVPVGSAVYLLPPGCEPGGFVGDGLLKG